MKLVFLVEELSMKHLLDTILPRILPDGVDFQTIPHNGKSDLRASIPRKIRGWNEPEDVRFVIVHDQDGKDCIKLKQSLLSLCRDTTRPVLIRIACQELEAWYFGDTNALAVTYNRPELRSLSGKSKYRIPDNIPSPKENLRRIIPEHQQILGAKRIGANMDVAHNTSVSFNAFVSGVRRMSI